MSASAPHSVGVVPGIARISVFLHPEDTLARAVCARLHDLVPDRLLVASAAELAQARWALRLSADGRWSGTVTLPSTGQTVDLAAPGPVWCRLRTPAAPAFLGATADDRRYAIDETYALWLAWLDALGPRCLVPPSTRGLAGPQRSPLEWLRLAAGLGIPVRPTRWTTAPRRDAPTGHVAWPAPLEGPTRAIGQAVPTHLLAGRPALVRGPADTTAVVQWVDGRLVAPAALRAAWSGPLAALAAAADCACFEAVLSRSDDGWCLDDLSPWLATPLAGTVAAVADALVGRLEPR